MSGRVAHQVPAVSLLHVSDPVQDFAEAFLRDEPDVGRGTVLSPAQKPTESPRATRRNLRISVV